MRRGQRPHPADRGPLVQRGRRADPLLARRRSARAVRDVAPRPQPRRTRGRWRARSRPAACSTAAGQGRLRRTVEARARELRIDMVSVFTRGGRAAGGGRPAPPARRGAAAAVGRGAGRGRARRAARRRRRRPSRRGELARVAVPVRDRGGRGARRGGGLDLRSRRRWPPRRARSQERYTKYRKAESFKEPIKAVYLSLYLLPGAAHPVRRGLALALPGPPHHDAAAPGGGGRGAHRLRRARRARRLPVRRRRVHRPHRLLQPDVGAAGPQRGGGRAHAAPASRARTRSWRSGAA